jgi:hypothetical protein
MEFSQHPERVMISRLWHRGNTPSPGTQFHAIPRLSLQLYLHYPLILSNNHYGSWRLVFVVLGYSRYPWWVQSASLKGPILTDRRFGL